MLPRRACRGLTWPRPWAACRGWAAQPWCGKQYSATWVDSFGGSGTQTSPGWDGNKLVLTGNYTSNGQKIPARDTFEQANATTLVHTSEVQANGQWITLQSETCTKQ